MHSRDATDWRRLDPPGGARVAREADEFERLETTNPHGVSAAQIVDFFAALDKAIAEKIDIKASRRRELERMLNDGRRSAHQFIKDMERTVSQITAREETGKGDR